MKKIILLSILVVSAVNLYSQRASSRPVFLIPQPVQYEVSGHDEFILPAQLNIVVPTGNDEVKKIALRLSQQINRATNTNTKVIEGKSSNPKVIYISISQDNKIPKEGYRLKVTKSGITLIAREPAGIFYGVQTLLQLFPPEIASKTEKILPKWTLPVVSIEDHPRFGWRGLMLDVSRHFFTVPEVKEFIDDMVKYKFNLLHLHLTDDQGWRIEIKSLPKLTEVGAWRVNKTGTFGTFSNPAPDEPKDYGGFYTHDDIRDLVQYASERFVNILPEIDVPGHSMAALASYPELSCTPGEYRVNSGEQFMIWPPGGHFYGLIDNTLCPANEKVYEFMDKVFSEVARLFPFDYIHMGGDETARNFWEKTPAIQEMMKKENLKNLDEVQSYFVKRMETIIRSKGKKMIGWDEILQGGLAPNAAVMSWRGMKGGIEAAKLGHEVVMSPTDFAYIDYMQGDRLMEPPVYASLRLKKAYQFEPVPAGIDSSLIKGGQANLWTEQIYNTRHAQYMVWPRAFAISEALWSQKSSRNWENFVRRVEHHFDRLEQSETNYSPAIYDPIIEAGKKDSTTLTLKLSTEIDELDIHYSFDNSFPDKYYPEYKEMLIVPKDARTVKVITYRSGKPIGRMMVLPVEELKKRAGIK